MCRQISQWDQSIWKKSTQRKSIAGLKMKKPGYKEPLLGTKYNGNNKGTPTKFHFNWSKCCRDSLTFLFIVDNVKLCNSCENQIHDPSNKFSKSWADASQFWLNLIKIGRNRGNPSNQDWLEIVGRSRWLCLDFCKSWNMLLRVHFTALFTRPQGALSNIIFSPLQMQIF